MKGPVLKTGRSVITCVGSNPTLSAMKAIPTFFTKGGFTYMRKEYEVTCQVDMCAERVEKVRVTTNLEAKAIKLAEEKLKKAGHFHVSIIRCKEVKD